VPTLAPRTLLAYQHTWLSLFEPIFAPFTFTIPPIVFVFLLNKFFLLLPPGSCHPLFTFPYPFHLPDLLQPACFSACLFSVLPLLSVVVRVSWTEGDSVRVGKPHTSLSTIPGHRQSSTCAESPVLPDQASKARERLSFSPLTPPLSPLWSRP
jgi:hypothetical protein